MLNEMAAGQSADADRLLHLYRDFMVRGWVSDSLLRLEATLKKAYVLVESLERHVVARERWPTELDDRRYLVELVREAYHRRTYADAIAKFHRATSPAELIQIQTDFVKAELAARRASSMREGYGMDVSEERM